MDYWELYIGMLDPHEPLYQENRLKGIYLLYRHA